MWAVSKPFNDLRVNPVGVMRSSGNIVGALLPPMKPDLSAPRYLKRLEKAGVNIRSWAVNFGDV